MNLNISPQIMSYFQGNSNNCETVSNKDIFTDMLEQISTSDNTTLELETENEIEIEIETEIDVDIETDIDYDLIQNILSNLQILKESMPVEEFRSMLSEINEIEPSIAKELLDTFENINENINGNSNVEEFFQQEILNILEPIKDNEAIDFKILENINNEDNLVDELILDDKYIQNETKVDQNNESNLKKEESYEDLEFVSSFNKSNLTEAVSSEQQDKELNTLESILGDKENDNILFVDNLNINNSQVVMDSNEEQTQTVSTIRQEFVGEDVVKTVRYMKSNGIEEINVKVSPRELGDITIKLIKNTEETKVQIIISKEEAFDLIQSNLGDITKHLEDLNINVKEVSVDIKSNNEKMFSDNLNQSFDKKNQENRKNKNRSNLINNNSSEDDFEIENIQENLNILI